MTPPKLVLDALTLEDLRTVRVWRLAPGVRSGLRTPVILSDEHQQEFYRTMIVDRSSPHRYFAVRQESVGERRLFRAMVGLTYLQWENGLAELSLITDPSAGGGIGEPSLRLLLDEGFLRLRLQTIFGECYTCNPALGFWKTMAERYRAIPSTLPRRKWWGGRLYDSFVFSFLAERWIWSQDAESVK